MFNWYMSWPCSIHIFEDSRGVLALLWEAAATIGKGKKQNAADDHWHEHHLPKAVHCQCHHRGAPSKWGKGVAMQLLHQAHIFKPHNRSCKSLTAVTLPWPTGFEGKPVQVLKPPQCSCTPTVVALYTGCTLIQVGWTPEHFSLQKLFAAGYWPQHIHISSQFWCPMLHCIVSFTSFPLVKCRTSNHLVAVLLATARRQPLAPRLPTSYWPAWEHWTSKLTLPGQGRWFLWACRQTTNSY